MTVSTSARKQDFAGGQAALTYNFYSIPDYPEYIKVTVKETATGTETDLTYSTDYTVAQESDGVGGIVTVSPTYSTAYTYTVWRDTGKVQGSDYDDYNQFPANTLERDLDRLMCLTQEMSEDIDRAIKNPITDSSAVTLAIIQSYSTTATEQAAIATSEATTATDQAIEATTQANIATSEATTCVAAVASVELPLIAGGDAGKYLQVNSGESAYELAALELATSAEAIAGTNHTKVMTPSMTSIAISSSAIAITALSDDDTLAGTSSTEVVSERAVKAYVDANSGSQIFTSSGTFTVPAEVYTVFVTIVAGGGGGGGALKDGANNTRSGGGGAGVSIINQPVAVTPAQEIAIVVGAGGDGGIGNNNGSNGEDSVWDNGGSGQITADHGNGGTCVAGSVGVGGDGGDIPAANVSGDAPDDTASAVYGAVIFNGKDGGDGGDADVSGANYSGAGGGSVFGKGGTSVQNANGNDGEFPGVGGSGASDTATTTRTGGAGADGIVIVRW